MLQCYQIQFYADASWELLKLIKTKQIIHLTLLTDFFILYTDTQVRWQTVKMQMK